MTEASGPAIESTARVLDLLAERVRRCAVAPAAATAAVDEEGLEPVGEALGDGEPAQRGAEGGVHTTIRGPAP